MPYTGAPSTVTNDAIRLLVGDVGTTTATEFLTDAAYTYFSSVSSSVYHAAILAANSLAALNGGKGLTKKVGDLSYTLAGADHYRALAKELQQRIALGVAPIAGGISRAAKQAREDDSDRVVPAFRRNQFDFPPGSSAST